MFLILFAFMQSRIRVLVKKCYFLIDVDEQHHGFSTLRYAIKICNEGMQQRYAIKIGSKKTMRNCNKGMQ